MHCFHYTRVAVKNYHHKRTNQYRPLTLHVITRESYVGRWRAGEQIYTEKDRQMDSNKRT